MGTDARQRAERREESSSGECYRWQHCSELLAKFRLYILCLPVFTGIELGLISRGDIVFADLVIRPPLEPFL